MFGKWWEHIIFFKDYSHAVISGLTMQAYFYTRSIPPKTVEQDITNHQGINKRF